MSIYEEKSKRLYSKVFIVEEFRKVNELIYDIYKYQYIKIASQYSIKKKWQKKSGGNPMIYLRRR